MDSLTFLSKLVDSLAWPAVTLLIVYWLKDAIAQRLKGLRKLKWADKEAEFAEGLEELKKEADAVQLPTNEELEKIEESSEDRIKRTLLDLASLSPEAAVVQAWKEVDQAAKAILMRDGRKRGLGKWAALQVIEREWPDDTKETMYHLVRRLSALRNQAVHEEAAKISASDARDYVLVALGVADAFRQKVRSVNPT